MKCIKCRNPDHRQSSRGIDIPVASVIRSDALTNHFTRQNGWSEQPIIEQPIIEQPIIEQPIIEQPIIEQPIIEQPIIEQPIIEQPIMREQGRGTAFLLDKQDSSRERWAHKLGTSRESC
jgi:hypothetical protein